MPYLEKKNTHSEAEANAICQNQWKITEYKSINQPKEQARGENGIQMPIVAVDDWIAEVDPSQTFNEQDQNRHRDLHASPTDY